MTIEIQILQAFYALRGPLLNELFIPITALGSVAFAAVLLTGLYLVNQKELTKQMFLAYTLNSVVTWIMKVIINRPRPSVEDQIVQNAFNFSFPSGHTSTAFVLATVLAWKKPEARTYFFSIAALVCLSRLYLGVHYPSDVIVGASIGILSGLVVLKRDQIREYVAEKL